MRLPRGASRNTHEKAVATCTGCPGSTGGRTRREQRVPTIFEVCCQVIQRVVWLSLRAAAALGLRGSSVGRAPSDRRPPTADDVDADPLSGPGAATPTARACIGRTRQPTLALRPATDTHPAASRAVRSPRARGLRTHATSDLMRLTTCAPFRTVTRLQCRLTEEGYDMHLDLDVNTDLWPLELGERFTFALASTLSLDGAPDTGALGMKTRDRRSRAHEAALSARGTL
eukprot:scaffold110101_cov65-Phaeocystis_antarctica.AAC.3